MDETAKRKPTVWDELSMRIRTLTGQIESAHAEREFNAQAARDTEQRIKDMTALRDEYQALLEHTQWGVGA